MEMEFEEYLRKAMELGFYNFHIKPRLNTAGELSFFIHPEGTRGATKDFTVKGSVLTPTASLFEQKGDPE